MKALREDVRARKAVEVARDRQAEVIQHRWRDVDDRRARKIAFGDMPAERHHEAIGRALVAAAQLRIADDTLEHALAKTQRLHAESRHDEQQIVGAERRHRASDDAVEIGVVLLEHAAVPQPLFVRHVAERARQRVAQIVVADGIDARIPDGRELHRPQLAERLRRSARQPHRPRARFAGSAWPSRRLACPTPVCAANATDAGPGVALQARDARLSDDIGRIRERRLVRSTRCTDAGSRWRNSSLMR